jgi:hypothetical protein
MRCMVTDDGVMYCFTQWGAFGNRTSEGFQDLVAANMIDRTAEAIVVRFADRFPSKVPKQARQRLADAAREVRRKADA